MFRRWRGSWRFGIDVSSLLHAALFVRDALALPVADGPDVPPRLEALVADLAGRVAPDVRAEAEQDWPTWWDSLLSLELRKDQAAGDPDKIRALLRGLAEAVDAPDWSSLRDRPGLRAAVQVGFEQGYRWADTVLPPLKHPDPTRPVFAWERVRDVAEQVRRRHQVDMGAVRGSAKVLVVEGRWWTLAAPGVVLCSAVAAEDETTAQQVLQLAFESAVVAES